MTASLPFDDQFLSGWLSHNIASFEGPFSIKQFQGGRSNPTFLISARSGDYVLRSKPGLKSQLLPSAHAIEREFRLLSALSKSAVPVPQPLALCEDESLIGRAFYVMSFMSGQVFFEQSLPQRKAQEREIIYAEMNRMISLIHRQDWHALGLSDFGRSGSYFQRQIARWSRQYLSSVDGPIADMTYLIEWLPDHIPQDGDPTTLVHGDFRMDNLIFDPDSLEIKAVLDWELSTLGHPLADFSYHCLAWHLSPDLFRGIAGLDLSRLGIPSESDYIKNYCDRTGREFSSLMKDWPFFIAFNIFRLAAILQGVSHRAHAGLEASAGSVVEGDKVQPLAQLARQVITRSI